MNYMTNKRLHLYLKHIRIWLMELREADGSFKRDMHPVCVLQLVREDTAVEQEWNPSPSDTASDGRAFALWPNPTGWGRACMERKAEGGPTGY